MLNILEYQTDDALFAKGLLEFHNIRVCQHPKQFDFADGGFADELIVFGLLELLNGDEGVILGVAAAEHNPVGTLADDTEYFVFLHMEKMTIIIHIRMETNGEDLWKPIVSRFLENQDRECNDSLQEDFKELYTAPSEVDFQRAYNAVIDDPISIGSQSKVELKHLWQRSEQLKLTPKLYLMRQTIAVSYVKALNELSENSEICCFLETNLPVLVQQRHRIQCKSSEIFLLYLLLAKSQLNLKQFIKVQQTLGEVERLSAKIPEQRRNMLLLKVLYMRSKLAEAQSNKEQEYLCLVRAVELTKNMKINSNFVSKILLQFQKVHQEIIETKRANAEKNREHSRSRRELKSQGRQDHNNAEPRLSIHGNYTRADIKAKQKKLFTDISAIGKDKKFKEPWERARVDQPILKSLYQKQKTKSVYKSIYQKKAIKQKENDFLKQEAQAKNFDFQPSETIKSSFSISQIDTKNLTQINNLILKRPSYAKISACQNLNPQSQPQTLPKPLEPTPQQPLNSHKTIPNLTDVNRQPSSISCQQSIVVERSFHGSPVHQNVPGTPHHSSSDEYPQNSQPFIFDRLEMAEAPRHSLLDEFIDINTVAKFQYVFGTFFLRHVPCRIREMELEFSENSGVELGLKMSVKMILGSNRHIILKKVWSIQRQCNCKQRLKEFFYKVLGKRIEQEKFIAESIKGPIIMNSDLLIKTTLFYIVSSQFDSKRHLTGPYFLLNFNHIKEKKRESINKQIILVTGTEYYRNIVTIDKIKKAINEMRMHHQDNPIKWGKNQKKALITINSLLNLDCTEVSKCQGEGSRNELLPLQSEISISSNSQTSQKITICSTQQNSNQNCLKVLSSSFSQSNTPIKHKQSILHLRPCQQHFILYDPIVSSYTMMKRPTRQLVNTADGKMHQLFCEVSLLSKTPMGSTFSTLPNLNFLQSRKPKLTSLHPHLPSSNLLCHIKSSLICSHPSNNFLATYFTKTVLLYQCWIKCLGPCLLTLSVFHSKDIYSSPQQFFKIEVVPNQSKCKVLKFVATRDDITKITGNTVEERVGVQGLYAIVVKLWEKVVYTKQRIYNNICFKGEHPGIYYFGNRLEQDVEETTEDGGKSIKQLNLTQNQEKQQSFLSLRLKQVKYLLQKTIKLTIQQRQSYFILSVQRFETSQTFTIFLYSPETNRQVSFQLHNSILSRLTLQERQFILGSIPQSQRRDSPPISLLSSHLFGAQTSSRMWSRFVSLIKFSSEEFGDRSLFYAQLAGVKVFTKQTHFSEFVHVMGHMLHMEMRLLRKEQTKVTSLVESFQSISVAELGKYIITLQILFIPCQTSINLVFSLSDFIRSIISRPHRRTSHPDLNYLIFNFADIRFMFKAGRYELVRCLEEVGLIRKLAESVYGLNKLHRVIESRFGSLGTQQVEDRHRNASMNCFKGREKNQYLKVIYKGILRFKNKTICGMFCNQNNLQIVFDNKRTLPDTAKEIPLSQINFPFVPQAERRKVLEVCHRRIFKGLKNRLILGIV